MVIKWMEGSDGIEKEETKYNYFYLYIYLNLVLYKLSIKLKQQTVGAGRHIVMRLFLDLRYEVPETPCSCVRISSRTTYSLFNLLGSWNTRAGIAAFYFWIR